MDGIEARLEGIDGRLEQIEARLGTVLTKDEFEGARATLLTKEEFERARATLLTKEEFERTRATLLTKDEFERTRATLLTKDEFEGARAADRDEMRRHFEIVTQHFQQQVGLIAEGHQMLVDGQARILDRFDRLERDLGTTIKLAYGDLDRRLRKRRPS